MATEEFGKPQKPFRCVTCNRSFYTQNCLQQHQCVKSHGGYCKCDICDKSFYDLDHIRYHACVELGDPRYYLNRNRDLHPCKFLLFGRCHTMDDKIQTKCDCEDLNQNRGLSAMNKRQVFSISEGNKLLSCKICNKTFGSSQALKYHTCMGNDQEICEVPMPQTPILQDTDCYPCGVCSKSFASEYLLINHSCFHRSRENYSQNYSDSDSSSQEVTCMTTNNLDNPHKRHLVDDEPQIMFKKEKIDNQNELDEEVEPLETSSESGHEQLEIDNESGNERLETSSQSGHVDYNHVEQNNDMSKVKKDFSIGFSQRHDFHLGQNKNLFFMTNGQFFPPMAMAGLNFPDVNSGADFPTRCTICNKIFSHKGNLKIHMRIHSDERPFKCPYCQKGFTMKQNMEIHIRIHTGEKPFKCEQCDHRFTTKQQMQKHMQNHMTLNPYGLAKQERCIKCGMYRNIEELRDHICMMCWTLEMSNQQHHNGEADKPSNLNSTLTNGLKNSTNSDQNFEKTQNLSEVQASGSSGSLSDVVAFYNCDVCGKVFSNRASLHAHLLTHESIKWYKCNFCEKQFRLKQTKDVHERIHTGCSPFRCGHCGKAFTTQQNMQKHICKLEI